MLQGLISSDGRVRRFNVAFAGTNQNVLFPKAHTCFNRLDLPTYNSKEVMAEYLKMVRRHSVIAEGSVETNVDLLCCLCLQIVQMDITGFTIE